MANYGGALEVSGEDSQCIIIWEHAAYIHGGECAGGLL